MPTINRTKFLNLSLNNGREIFTRRQVKPCGCAIGAYIYASNSTDFMTDNGKVADFYSKNFLGDALGGGYYPALFNFDKFNPEYIEGTNKVTYILKCAEAKLLRQGRLTPEIDPDWAMKFKLDLLEQLIEAGVEIEEELATNEVCYSAAEACVV